MVAPSGERLRGEGRYGVFAVEKLCDPYLSASEMSILYMGRYTISVPLPLTYTRQIIGHFGDEVAIETRRWYDPDNGYNMRSSLQFRNCPNPNRLYRLLI